jgi:hypothetical protein
VQGILERAVLFPCLTDTAQILKDKCCVLYLRHINNLTSKNQLAFNNPTLDESFGAFCRVQYRNRTSVMFGELVTDAFPLFVLAMFPTARHCSPVPTGYKTFLREVVKCFVNDVTVFLSH